MITSQPPWQMPSFQISPLNLKLHNSPFILLYPIKKPMPLEKLDPDCSCHLHLYVKKISRESIF